MAELNPITMKRFFTILFFNLFIVVFINAQCSIDYSYFPIGENYGLYPDTLPVGVVGQTYNQDLTFYLPVDTIFGGVFVEFTDFHITSISLPLGITWECNNSSNACHYDPLVSQYGCVNVSGTPLVVGNYDVEVNLVATHSLSALLGTESISFSLPMTIINDTSTSNNAGFAMTNSSGCAPITVSFTNNNTSMLSYFWDFGNGNTSTMQNPVDQLYSQAGQYIVQYSAMQSNPTYFLENIEVFSGTCTDNFLIGDVDLLYDITTSSGVVQSVPPSNAITQAFPLMINLSNPLQLTGQDVTIEVWDDDGWISGLEYCGGVTFTPPQQAGTFSANGGGLSINYTIIELPANTVITADTINVYGFPTTPVLVYDTLNNLIYTTSDSTAMQWYYYNSPIPGANDTFLEPTASGLYSLVVVNENGCINNSLEVLIVICDSSYQPMLDDNGSTAWMLDSALYSDLQWYSVITGIINGANNSFFPATENGEYYIVATDTFGCSYISAPVYLSPFVSSEVIFTSEIVKVGPNPIKNGLSLNIYIEASALSPVVFVLIDFYGREVVRKVVHYRCYPYQLEANEISKLSNGVYYLDISFDDKKIRKKVVKLGAN
ncbi:PKD domain-containing protein [Flavobacteriales bacterium]|nr:PKD domain-containing protein [Flavobacteriales bacterium]MDA8857920.1 PKD domain-containing protein [Flavobacteriales bacterium]